MALIPAGRKWNNVNWEEYPAKKASANGSSPGMSGGFHPMNREGVSQGDIHPRRAAGFFIPGMKISPTPKFYTLY